jgi:hypothetical protein
MPARHCAGGLPHRHDRCRQLTVLAGAQARELSELARTFLRHSGDNLSSESTTPDGSSNNSRTTIRDAGLSDSNIGHLIAFVEEIDHALHAALAFRRGERDLASEDFVRNLELQARVDTYLVLLLFVAFFRKTQRVSRADRRWLRFHLFERDQPEAYQSETLRARVHGNFGTRRPLRASPRRPQCRPRVDEIRIFHSLDYQGKKDRILQLKAPDKPKT